MSKIAVIGSAGESASLKVNALHTGGETVEAFDIHFEPGGKGFNQAVAAARHGADVSFLSAVGDDGYGAKIEGFLRKENIRGVLPIKPGRTAYASIVTDRAGNNRVTVYTGVKLTSGDVLRSFAAEIAAADILLLNNEVPEDVNAAAAEIAGRYGVKIILNPAPSRSLPADFRKQIYLATPNEYEQAGLDGVENIVITLGGDGCLIKQTDQKIPSIKTDVTDTTGAGDTFSGVLAAALAEGNALETACKLATAAAAISVSRPYVNAAIPSRNETETLYKLVNDL